MSIKTMATPGGGFERCNGLAPGSSSENNHATTFQNTAQSKNVSDIIVNDKHLFSDQSIVGTMQPFQHFLFLWWKIRDHPMQKQCGLVQETFRRFHTLDHDAASQGVKTCVLFGRQILPSKYDNG
jgi:hypothetical protein